MAENTEQVQTPKKYGPWGLREHGEEILTLRLQGLTLQEIATKFGTSRESIRNVVARELLAIKKSSLPQPTEAASATQPQGA